MQSEVGCKAFVCLLTPRTAFPSQTSCFCHRDFASLFPLQQIRKLRRELESSQEKVATLTSQLSANVSAGKSGGPGSGRPELDGFSRRRVTYEASHGLRRHGDRELRDWPPRL